MKYVFLFGFVLLVIASLVTALNLPGAQSDVPIIYWVTDSNPARLEQVRLFHVWQVKNGHYNEVELKSQRDADGFLARNATPAVRETVREMNEKGPALIDGTLTEADFPLTIKIPKTELRLDMANSDQTKKVIQGVSGVAGDVMDQSSGGTMRYFRAIGLNTDVTEAAKELNFDMSQTYPALEPELMLEENGELRQFQFPCNVAAPLYFVNLGTLEAYGMPAPPKRWTLDEFEAYGLEFVEKANEGLARRMVFLADTMPIEVIRSSLGGSRFNETATASALDQPPHVETWRRYKDWMYKYRIIPSSIDRAQFTTESGYGGASAQLFVSQDRSRGQYAMMWTGRYMLIEFRKPGRPELKLGVTEAPHGGFPNTSIATRAAMVYAGGKNKDLAKLFLAFLASEEYNMQIVKDGDSLPPNPKYTELEEYKRPKDYPNEHAVHEPFAEAATELAVGSSYSPFVLHATAERIENWGRDHWISGMETLEGAVYNAHQQMNAEIQRTLDENPKLRPLYDRLIKQQEQIDALKPQIIEFQAKNPGKPVPEELKIPMELLENPFHKAYYKHLGWTK